MFTSADKKYVYAKYNIPMTNCNARKVHKTMI